MNYQEALMTIKNGDVKSVYLLYGTERYFVEDLTKKFQNEVVNKDDQSLNVVTLDMTQQSVQTAVKEAETLPFFSDKKVVIALNCSFLTGQQTKSSIEHDVSYLENYLKNPLVDTTLVLVAPYEKLDQRKKIVKSLRKNAIVIDCHPLDEKTLRDYVIRSADNATLKFTKESLNLFVERTGFSLDKAINELDKLNLATDDSGKITTQMVLELVPKTTEESVFDLVNQLLARKLVDCLETYQELLSQKEEPIRILALLMSQFRLLLQVSYLQRSGYQTPDLLKALKVHQYRLKLAQQSVRRYSTRLLEEVVIMLNQLDYDIKTGRVKPEIALELMLIRFCRDKAS